MKTETMSFESICPQCGESLSADAPMGMCPRCLLAEVQQDASSALPDLLDQANQSMFGDYELIELIARGGMGVVYRARQKSLNRQVALKMILSGQLASEQEVQRFQSEAKAAAHLRHPNIVTVHEVGEMDGRHFYSMEYVQGKHLGERMQENPLPQKQAVQYLVKIARAVHFAHENGIVHRDLKPQNILLDHHDEPRITDFGLAKRMDLEGDLTMTGTLIGSPAYMAPEQAQGKQYSVGPLTDVYALGALFYCMLVGRPPFRAMTPLETLKQVTDSNPQSLRQINPYLPIDLDTICQKCLEKEPAHRYQSAEELAQELERWLSNEPILARRSTAKERIQKWTRRNPILTSMSALVLVVGMVALLLVSWQLRQTRSALAKAEQLIVAEATARATEMEPYLTMSHDGPVSSVTFGEDGRRILSSSHDHTARIWDARTGKLIRELSGHTGVVGKAVFSPDEQQVMTLSFDTHFRYPHLSPTDELGVTTRIPRYGDQTVRVWNTDSGESIAMFQHPNQVVDAAFSPDGKHVVTASWDHLGRIWDVETGREIHSLAHHQAALLSARFSPDGTQVVTTSSGSDYQITIHPGGGGGSTSSVYEKHLASIWEVETGKTLDFVENQSRNGIFFARPRSSRSVMEYSKDGKWLLVAGAHPSNAILWNVRKQRVEHVLKGHTTEVTGARFSADGTKAVSYGADRNARIWDVASGEQTALLAAHKETILWAEFSTDGNLVVTASGDGTARVWDAGSGVGISVLKGHADKVYQARFSPDGLRVVTASEDGTLRLWDAATLTQMSKVLRGHERSVLSIDISSDGKKVVTGSSDGSARLWDMDSQKTLFVLDGYKDIKDDQIRRHALGDVSDVSFSADDQFVLTASEDSYALMRPVDISGNPSGEDLLLSPFSPLRLWNVQTGQLEKRFEDLPSGVRSIRWSGDGNHFAAIPTGDVVKAIRLKGIVGRGWSGSSQKLNEPYDLSVWSIDSGNEWYKLHDIINELKDVAFSADGKWVATADQGPVRLWNGKSGELIKALPGSEGAGEVAFVNETDQLLVKDMRGANLWDLESGRCIQTYPSPDIPFLDVTFHVDLERVLGWTQEKGMVCLFDMSTGELLLRIDDAAKRLRKALLSPDGRLLVTIGWDKTAIVWDAHTGDRLENLEGHEDDILDAVISPDGRWLGTVSEDYTARLWPLNIIRTVR